MRLFLTTAILLGSAAAVRADTYVYVSMAPEKKIQIFKLLGVFHARDGA